MQLNTYLSFNGQCKEAFQFYAKTFNGKIAMIMTYGESPMAAQTDPAFRDNVMHAALDFDGQRLTGADAPPQRYQKPQGMSVLLSVNEAAEAERIFQALSENGVVHMPMQETFWALRFGVVVDRFGTPWMVNCAKPM